MLTFALSAATILAILLWPRKPKPVEADEQPMFMHGTLTTYQYGSPRSWQEVDAELSDCADVEA